MGDCRELESADPGVPYRCWVPWRTGGGKQPKGPNMAIMRGPEGNGGGIQD